MERWKPVLNDLNYEVSSLGRIRNSMTGYVLKPSPHPKGYVKVTLSNRRQRLIHNVAMETFVGSAGKLTVNHKDGDKSNNCLSNLEYLPLIENVHHAMHVLGHWFQGEKCGNSRLTSNDVTKIRELRKQGLKLQEIADQFDCSFQHVSDITNNKRWRHLCL